MSLSFTLAVLVLIGIFVSLFILYLFSACPTELHELPDGSFKLPGWFGSRFATMNDFEQWWTANYFGCDLPVLTGSKKAGKTGKYVVLNKSEQGEQLYATTPINKVDDYEFSRIFGYEKDGRMEIPRQNFNLILQNRSFDWTNQPLSSNERTAKASVEGFISSGESGESGKSEGVQRYREKISRVPQRTEEDEEVDRMIERIYKDDPDYAPIVTRIGPNHWEVNELKPRIKFAEVTDDNLDDNRVVDTSDDHVKIGFKYPNYENEIDPYFPTGDLPWENTRDGQDSRERGVGRGRERQGSKVKDPFAGPVPNMERMFGPTFDHKNWIVQPFQPIHPIQ